MDPGMTFAQRIDALLEQGGVRQVVRAVDAGTAGMPADASLMEEPRCIVALEGEAVFQLQERDAVREVRLQTGDGLFVAPRHWVRSRLRQSYTSMGAVFYRDSIRFYLMRGQASGERRTPGPAETFIVPAALREDGRALCRLLAGPAPAGNADRYFRNAFECVLIGARAVLAEPREVGGVGAKARFTFEAARAYMADHLHRPLSRKDVARHVGVHPNHLSRLFADFGAGAFSAYLQDLRLERARLLLADPRLNIAEVAQLSGFTSANYFTRLFRQRTGKTPTRSRK